MPTDRNGVQEIRSIAIGLHRRRIDLLMLALITGLLVAACSSPSPREPSTNTPATRQSNAPNQSNPSNTTGFNPTNPSAANQDNTPNQNVSPPTADAGSANPPAASQNSPSTPAALPGTEEFGLSREGLVKSIETVESLIARCMSDAGFEYIAVDYNTVRRGMTADKSLPGYSDREYLAQFGYGLSTLYTGLPPQLSDVLTPAKIGLGEQNVRIFNDLSPADQVAYNHTLFGEYADATFAVALETEDFSRAGGCTRAGIEQVFGSEVLNLTYYSPLDALLQQDPRMIEALAQFANCMRDAGFNYSNPNDVEPDIRKRLYDITQGAPPEALSSDARSALAELQGEERAVAVVAENCTIRIIEPIEDQVMRELYAAPVR